MVFCTLFNELSKIGIIALTYFQYFHWYHIEHDERRTHLNYSQKIKVHGC